MVLIFTVLVTFIGWGLLASAAYEGELSRDSYISRQALYIAEAGAQRAQAKLATEEDWNSVPSPLYSDEPFAGGTYSVSVSIISPDVALILSQGVFMGKTRTVEVKVEPRT